MYNYVKKYQYLDRGNDSQFYYRKKYLEKFHLKIT